MATTEERVRQLITNILEVYGQPLDLPEDLDTGLTELGVSSLDIVVFAKLVTTEFNVTYNIEDCQTVNTIRKLIEHLDGKVG